MISFYLQGSGRAPEDPQIPLFPPSQPVVTSTSPPPFVEQLQNPQKCAFELTLKDMIQSDVYGDAERCLEGATGPKKGSA